MGGPSKRYIRLTASIAEAVEPDGQVAWFWVLRKVAAPYVERAVDSDVPGFLDLVTVSAVERIGEDEFREILGDAEGIYGNSEWHEAVQGAIGDRFAKDGTELEIDRDVLMDHVRIAREDKRSNVVKRTRCPRCHHFVPVGQITTKLSSEDCTRAHWCCASCVAELRADDCPDLLHLDEPVPASKPRVRKPAQRRRR